MKTGLLSLLFPPKCPSCGALLEFQGFGRSVSGLCEDCKKRWNSELLDTCGACGQAVKDCGCMTEELRRAKCAGFRKRVYYLHGTRQAVQNRILYRIKDHPAAGAIEFLTEELAESLSALMKDAEIRSEDTVLVYLPRSRRSAAVSGTDQGKWLAYGLSQRTGLPVAEVIRRRRGRERQQKHLNYSMRRKNAKETYTVAKNASLKGKTAILIDDIVTTGCTMAAGARLLRKIGAERVYALSVAVDDHQKNAEIRQPTFKI